jgi:hypothetical protein
MSTPEGGHVLVIGVDGVRFDFPGPDSAPSVWTPPGRPAGRKA